MMQLDIDSSRKVSKHPFLIRGTMVKHLNDHSQDASQEEMMLDEEAELLGREEIPEILDMLPDYKGKDVLELGAGIG